MHSKTLKTILSLMLALALFPSAAFAVEGNAQADAFGTFDEDASQSDASDTSSDLETVLGDETNAGVSESDPAEPNEDAADDGTIATDSVDGEVSADGEEIAEEEVVASVDEGISLAALANPGEQTVADGVYEIASSADDSLVLDVVAGSVEPGANVTLWTSYGADRQRFLFTYLDNGYYKITAVHSGQALDVVGSGQASATNVTQWSDTGADNQQWVVRENGDGTFDIVSKCNNLVLSAYAQAVEGANVVVATDRGASHQKWRLEPVGVTGYRTVADGIYEIANAADVQQVLDIGGAYLGDGGNAQVWTASAGKHQRFRLTYLNNGCYKITAVHSGQALDVVGSGQASATNVTQWSDTGADNQQWVVRENGDGTFDIVSKCNNLVLSAYAQAVEGANVVVATDRGASHQKWKLNSLESVEDGVYYVSNSQKPSQVLDVVAGSTSAGANVTLWTNYDSAWQRYRFTYLGEGSYRIVALHSGMALDVEGSGKVSGTNVSQWNDVGTSNQQWMLRDNGDGKLSIVSACNGLALSPEGSVKEGTNIVVATDERKSSQQWTLAVAPPVADGVYFIASAIDGAHCLDVEGGSTAEGANVSLWQNDGNVWQKFRLEYQGDGYYRVIAAHSGQALDVVASSNVPGTNVTQWGWWGTDNQLWQIKESSAGVYKFVSKCNGLYLDIADGTSRNGSNVVVKTESAGPSQNFALIPTEASEVSVKTYSFTVNQLLDWQRESSYANYSDEEGLRALSPDTYTQADDEYYRFADLRGYSGLTAAQLDARIESTSNGRRGKLYGQGQAIVDAAKEYKLNEAFILSLAIVESGWGCSMLSMGTYYDGEGFWDDGEWVAYPGYAPGTYYNFYGIGAFDSDPFRGGIKMAVSEGWSSPAKAIAGGAEWIADGYVYSSTYPQETLYEMRWDVDRSEATRARGWHQYSTSISWDTMIAGGQMAVIYDMAGYDVANIDYIIPRYLN